MRAPVSTACSRACSTKKSTLPSSSRCKRCASPVATGNADVDAGYRMLFDYLKTVWADSVTELAIDYVRTFIGHGVNGYSAAYPFERVYERTSSVYARSTRRGA